MSPVLMSLFGKLVVVVVVPLVLLPSASAFSSGTLIAQGPPLVRSLYCGRLPLHRAPFHLNMTLCRGYCHAHYNTADKFDIRVSSTAYWDSVINVTVSSAPGSQYVIKGFAVSAINSEGTVVGGFESNNDTTVAVCNQGTDVEGSTAFHTQARSNRTFVTLQWTGPGKNFNRLRFRAWIVHSHGRIFYLESEPVYSMHNGSSTINLLTMLGKLLRTKNPSADRVLSTFENSFDLRQNAGYKEDAADPFKSLKRLPRPEDLIPGATKKPGHGKRRPSHPPLPSSDVDRSPTSSGSSSAGTDTTDPAKHLSRPQVNCASPLSGCETRQPDSGTKSLAPESSDTTPATPENTGTTFPGPESGGIVSSPPENADNMAPTGEDAGNTSPVPRSDSDLPPGPETAGNTLPPPSSTGNTFQSENAGNPSPAADGVPNTSPALESAGSTSPTTPQSPDVSQVPESLGNKSPGSLTVSSQDTSGVLRLPGGTETSLQPEKGAEMPLDSEPTGTFQRIMPTTSLDVGSGKLLSGKIATGPGGGLSVQSAIVFADGGNNISPLKIVNSKEKSAPKVLAMESDRESKTFQSVDPVVIEGPRAMNAFPQIPSGGQSLGFQTSASGNIGPSVTPFLRNQPVRGVPPFGSSRPGGVPPFGNSPSGGVPSFGSSRPGGVPPFGNSPSGGVPPFGNSRPGGVSPFGNSRPGGVPPFGNSPSGGVPPFGNSRPGGVSPFGNSPTGGVSPFGNSPTGGVSPFGNSPTGGVSPFGNSRPGGVPPFGNSRTGGVPPFGNSRPGGVSPFGNSPPNGVPPFGNSRPGGVSSFGNSPPNGVPPFGNSPPNGVPPFGNSPPNGVPPFGNSPPNGVPPFGNSPPNGVPPFGNSPPNGVPPFGNSPPNGVPPFGNSPPNGVPPFGNSPPNSVPPFRNSQSGGVSPFGNSPSVNVPQSESFLKNDPSFGSSTSGSIPSFANSPPGGVNSPGFPEMTNVPSLPNVPSARFPFGNQQPTAVPSTGFPRSFEGARSRGDLPPGLNSGGFPVLDNNYLRSSAENQESGDAPVLGSPRLRGVPPEGASQFGLQSGRGQFPQSAGIPNFGNPLSGNINGPFGNVARQGSAFTSPSGPQSSPPFPNGFSGVNAFPFRGSPFQSINPANTNFRAAGGNSFSPILQRNLMNMIRQRANPFGRRMSFFGSNNGLGAGGLFRGGFPFPEQSPRLMGRFPSSANLMSAFSRNSGANFRPPFLPPRLPALTGARDPFSGIGSGASGFQGAISQPSSAPFSQSSSA